MLERHSVLKQWANGATVCDPTAGTGAFILALLQMARDQHVDITQSMLSSLYLIEKKRTFLGIFKKACKERFDIDFPEANLICRDVILRPPKLRFDILVGNPPWCNFTDLPEKYAEKIKPYFRKHGLVKDIRDTLLGASRVDIAALVIKNVLFRLTVPHGKACFFLPLSLFCGDSAHDGFRSYKAMKRDFRVHEIVVFDKCCNVFQNVKTDYCAAKFELDTQQFFPISYIVNQGNTYQTCQAQPIRSLNSPLMVTRQTASIPALPAKGTFAASERPRQGINTCGANDIFIFDKYPDFLPKNYIYPLLTHADWQNTGDNAPSKWILLPYSDSGHLLTLKELSDSGLYDYLERHKDRLSSRPGRFLEGATKNNKAWWAMLGIGQYSFAPYKIVWEAMGKRLFTPIIKTSYNGMPWQANQAMQAYIPCATEQRAKEVIQILQSIDIPGILAGTNSIGKRNTAQPGKIARILGFSKNVIGLAKNGIED